MSYVLQLIGAWTAGRMAAVATIKVVEYLRRRDARKAALARLTRAN